MSKTLIIDYGAGNLRSVLNSVRFVAKANEHIELTADARDLSTADRIILPGVGAYHDCKANLMSSEGMIEALEHFVASGKPFFGICVGMQLLVQSGDEHGVHTQGLGWLSGHVAKIEPTDPKAKIPHMGWNNITVKKPHALFDGIEQGSDVYFVHSYAAQNVNIDEIIASVDYNGEMTAVIGRDNIVGAQFHPEKSQGIGLKMLRNFLDWRP